MSPSNIPVSERRVLCLRVITALFIVITLCLLIPWMQTQQAFASDGVIVSMGDSFSSGEGVPPFYHQGEPNQGRFLFDDFLARRSEGSWPGRLTIPNWGSSQPRDLKNEGWFFVAASGATTDYFFGRQRKIFEIPRFDAIRMGPTSGDPDPRYLPPQISVFAENNLQGEVDYVTLTIGGNDVGFVDVMVAGATHVPWVHNVFYDALSDAEREFEWLMDGRLEETYSRISQEAGGQAKIIIAGYPPLVSERPVAGLRGGFSREHARQLNLQVEVFNSGVRNIISELNSERQEETFFFACVTERFRNNEAFSRDPYIRGIVAPAQRHDIARSAISPASFHPNERGIEAYAEAVSATIAEIERDGNVGVSSGFTHNTSMVFDVSGSMNEFSLGSQQTKLDSAKEAGQIIISMARSQGDVGLGVVSFAHDAVEEQALTTSYLEVTNAIEGLFAHSTTNIKAGLELGVAQLEGASGDRMMIFLSDGMDTVGNSYDDIMAVARRANDLDITIHTIGFGYDFELDEPLLRSIANETGGTYVREDASSLVGLVGAYMRAQMSATSTVLHGSSGTVDQGEVVNVAQFAVNSLGDLRLNLAWPNSSLDVVLTDPSGVTVEEGYPGFSVVNEASLSQAFIENAAQGNWDLAVYGAYVPTEQTPFYVVAALTERPEFEVADPSLEATSLPETQTAIAASVDDSAGMILVAAAVIFLGGCGVLLFSRKGRGDRERDLIKDEPRRIK